MTDKTREEFEAWARPLIGEPCYSFIMNLMWSGYQEGQRKQQAVIDALRAENAELRATIINAKGYLESNEIAWALQELRG